MPQNGSPTRLTERDAKPRGEADLKPNKLVSSG